jgi:hypothetical protein
MHNLTIIVICYNSSSILQDNRLMPFMRSLGRAMLQLLSPTIWIFRCNQTIQMHSMRSTLSAP